MKGAAASLTPKQIAAEMIAAGACFRVHRRDNGLGLTFSYRVAAGGDRARCAELQASAKARPPLFIEAVRAEVQRIVSSEGDAHVA